MPIYETGKLKIHYGIKGKGEIFLLFSDNLHSDKAYEDDIEFFAKHYQVLTFDYPGMGKSTHELYYPDEREVDLWGYWADIACHLLMNLNISACFALGVCGGALTALQFAGKQARQHNIQVKGVIADSFLADWDSRKMHRWLDVREHYYVRNSKSLAQNHGDSWREVVDADTEFLRKLADRGGYQVPDAVLNSISCPVLLTGQIQDPTLTGIAKEYARISEITPDCNVYLSSKPNHPYLERPFMWSDPKTFRLLADHFLSGIKTDE